MDWENEPTKLIKMKSGYACIGNTQFLPGYCVLFANPEVSSLNDLSIQGRTEFLLDMSLLGDAIISTCNPLRINYGMLSNSAPILHAHLFPRFTWEPEHLQKRNVWQYPEEYWAGEEHQFNEDKHGKMKIEIAQSLQTLMDKTY